MAELILRAAVVLGAEPSKKLYEVQLCDNPPDIKPAIPLGGLHTFSNDTGAVNFVSYNVGDKVLVACYSNDWSARSQYCWIVGLLPLEEYSGDPDEYLEYSLYPGKLSELPVSLPALRNEALQTLDFSGEFDAREHSPLDLKSGDWSVGGEDTILNINDRVISIKAKKALISLDAITHSVTESSLFRNIYTAGQESRLSYYYGKLIHTNKLSGNFDDSYSEEPTFRHQEQLSDLLHGYRRATLTPVGSDEVPISLHTEELDGSVKTVAAGTLHVGRACDATWYKPIEPKLIKTNAGEGIPKGNKEDPLEYLKEDENWSKSQLVGDGGTLYETTFDIVSPEEWEAPDTDDTSEFTDPYTEERIEVSNKPSGLTCLSDGTVLIRDGFGSEIRMCHGNVQISAANNLILLGSRDILSLASGMITTNGGVGIEMGTGSGDFAVRSAGELNIRAEKYTLSAIESIRVVDGHSIDKCASYTLQSAAATLSSTGLFTIVAPETHVSGDGRLLLNTSMSALCIESNAIIVGATTTIFHSNINTSTSKFTISDVLNSDLAYYDLVVTAGNANVAVGGDLIVNDTLAVNGVIQTPNGVYSKFFAAKNVAPFGGVYGLRDAPEKVDLSGLKAEYKSSLGSALKRLITDVKSRLTEKAVSVIKKVFCRESKAFKIYNPPFGVKSSGAFGSITPASCSDTSSEVSYIYPGKRFWFDDGLATEDKERTNMADERELSYAGVVSIHVNSDNVITNKED